MLDLSKWKVALRRTADFFDRRHWVPLIVAAPFLLFPTPGRSLALLLIPATWLAGWLANGEPVPRTPLNAVVLFLSLMVLVSLFATYSIAVSLPRIAGIVLGIGIYYGVTRAGQHAHGWWLSFIVFTGLGVGIAALSLFGTRWIEKLPFLTPIIRGLPPILIGVPGIDDGLHPNEVAGALLWVMPALIILSIWLLTQVKAWRSSPRQPRTFALAGLVVAATLLVTGTFTLAQSRGGYLAVALTGVVLTLAVLPKHRGRLPVSILAVLLITIGTGYLFFGSSSISSGSGSTSRAASPALSLDTLEGRFEIWSHALSAIQDFPITGLGLNTFQQIVPAFYPLYSFSPDFDIGHAHNEFLQATLDLGLPGLIAFLSLYLIALWMLREIWNAARRYDVWPSIFGARLSAQGPETVTRCIVLGLTGGLLAHLFFGLTDAVPLGSKYGILFWMLLGLITGLFLQARAGVLIRPQTDPDRASLD